MVQINFALREVNCKIVYYGPGLSGKTTNLEVIHAKAPTEFRGELTSIATEGDRTLFFDFLPLNLGTVAGMKTKFQLYTVPGQVFYNSTRKLVLQGVDGIVFVADSRSSKLEENVESLDNLKENLREYGLKLDTIPLVIQYNKRDLADILSIEDLEKRVNLYNAPYIEAAAVTGQGVFPTLKKLAGMVLENLNRAQAPSSVHRKKPQPAREAVLATAGGREEAQASPAPPPRAEPGRQAAARPSAGSDVVREPMAAGVKPVERRVPVKPKVAPRKSPQAAEPGRGRTPAGGSAPVPAKTGSSRAVAARARQAPREPAPAAPQSPARKRTRRAIVVVLLLLALGGAGAYLYFSGMLEGFMGY